jgi:hypothetical protein
LVSSSFSKETGVNL